MKSEYDLSMNALAMRMSDCARGEDILNVATVCARMIAFAVNEAYETEQQKTEVLEKLIHFMRNDLLNMMQPKSSVQ
jgi:hypothetical protein